MTRDILFLAHRIPFPPDRGDKIRSYHILKHLAARARVHLVAFVDDPADRNPPTTFRDMLASIALVPRTKSRARAVIEALLTGRPASLTAFADPRIAAAVARHPDAATYVYSGQMAQYVAAPDVMDFGDVDSAKFAAYADAARGTLRLLMRREARLLSAFEQDVATRARATTLVTAAEAALFGGPRTHVIENGIDPAFFDPAASFARLPREDAPLIVFTGQMDYRPNIDAVTAFAKQALPTIRAHFPTARFAIVGRAPTAAVRALVVEGVIVTGAVEDVRPWLAAADVCVAPLTLARGIQNKVLEAMAMARPVVASAAAAEGIDHGGCIRVADADIGNAACDVLRDRPAAEAMGQGARAQVIRRYAWDAALAPLDALLGLDA